MLKQLFDPWFHDVSTLFEAVGIGIVALGAIVAVGMFIQEGLSATGWETGFKNLRARFGRSILLGLEFLVAADIIGTVALTPTFSNLGVLAIIVLIRTFLSFSLEIEIEGRWPWWRKASAREDQASSS